MRTLISAAVLLACAQPGMAAPDYTDTAQVISSTPIVERVIEQRQECVPDTAYAPAPPRERSLVGPIVGGVAGAVIGNQIGRGSGRTAATAGGAIAGAVIGDRVGNSDTHTAAVQPTQRCRVVETQREVIRGYSVVYRYNGRDIATNMPYNPGSTVRVAVGVAPDGPPGGYPASQPSGPISATPVGNAPPPPPPGGYQYPDGRQYRY